MKARETIHGFDVLARRELPEYRAAATRLIHPRTGCEVLHLAAADTENLFAFCFTTPPQDDTGVSHIIEHSVLSGSRRFTPKEPFSVLMKGSMHTFLNALTYPDKTVYPAASCNKADFFNLLAVYGDAVFHPLLRKETFMQEAWRLEEPPEGGGPEALRYAGIVFNEMKGARSSADSVVAEWTVRALFPDTPYRHESGGDPRVIPTLSLEAARAFHSRYYHPSNCRVFLYGNVPMEEVLSFLGESLLSGFTSTRVDAELPLQKRWVTPRRLEKTYAVQAETPLEGRSSVTLGWLLSSVMDPVELVTNEVLSEVLVESAGSPLRKALVDSGLGEDLSPVSGLETDLKEMVFAVGLRGTEPEKEKQVEALILDTLKELSTRGLPPLLVQSMIDRVEFRHREIRGSGAPYALRLMGRALRGWVHGMDPVTSLEFFAPMQELKRRIAADGRFLEKAIERNFISNPHRITLVVKPDRDQEERDAAAEREKLAAVLRGMSAAEKQAAVGDSSAFRAFQLAPDSPESLASIPSIHRADIPRQIERIPIQESLTAGGVPLSLHDIFTNQIAYVDLAFPTDALSTDQSLLLPLFGKAVCGLGLPGMPYDEVALELFRLTGGFSASLDSGGIVGHPDTFGQYSFWRVRCLRQNLGEAAGLVGKLLAGADFSDRARLRDIILELRNDMKSALVPAGHQFASLRAASMLSPAVAREEQWRGITQLLFLESLAEGIEGKLPALQKDLEAIRGVLFVKENLQANATAESSSFGEISSAIDGLAARLPRRGSAPRPSSAQQTAVSRPEGLRAESLVTSATVGYVARAVPGVRYEHPLNGPCAVLGHLLSTGYLWEKVRMEGGAYGAFSYPRNSDGLFLFGSYRDPHIVSSLGAFQEGLALMEKGTTDDAEVEKAVIGTIGREDRPLDPGEKGFVSLQRKLHGVTDEARQARRDKLIDTDSGALAEVAHTLRKSFAAGFTAVIANRQALADATVEMPDLGGRVVNLPE